MARTLPTAIIQAMTAPSSDVALLALLEIEHPNITTIRLVNNTETVTSGVDTFEPFPFSVSLPQSAPDAAPSIPVVVDNIDQAVVAAARTIAGSTAGLATANLYIVSADDPDTKLLSYEGYRVQNVAYTARALTFEMTLEFFTSEPFPGDSMRPGNFPGIF